MGCLNSKERQQPQASAASAAPAAPEPPGVKTEGSNLGAKIIAEGANPVVVDIIFLHGLTGSRDRTWTAEGSKESWLKTLLAEDLPNARIITYGYDADVVHLTSAAGLSTVRQHASTLLRKLSTLRTGSTPSATKRPIIFAVHSLGGLVCQDAIFSSQNATISSYRDILECTFGVIYFGTPHGGSKLAKFGKVLTDVVNLSLTRTSNRALLDVLEGDSDFLANIENDFMKLVNNRKTPPNKPIDLFVFLEDRPVNRIGRRVVEPESATIKGYESASIAADHMGMTKFGSRDGDYGDFLGVLREWIAQIKNDTGPIYDQSEPNDPYLGRDRYYPNRSNVKNHIRRDAFLQSIDESFEIQRENRSHIVILYALGGQGKTQLAIDYCHRGKKHARLDHRFYAIFFLDASSENTLREGMISLADQLSSQGQIFENDAHRIRFIIEKIRSWNRRWLLVLDNYDNPKAFSTIDKPKATIEEYIPHSNLGYILITSRCKGLDELGEVVPVPPMSPDEAKELLFKALETDQIGDRSTEAVACALRIVERLGCLPLAIHQAGAFIRRKGLSLEQFLHEYEIRKADIWTKIPRGWTYGETVYTTWELSYDLIDETDDGRSNKGAMLTMLAFLDFRGISREMFKVPRRYPGTEINKEANQGLTEPPWLLELLLNDGTWNPSRIDDLFDDFRELSLLQISDRQKQGAFKISLHPLVAEWIRYRVQTDKKRGLQCLFQASALVTASMKVLKTGHASFLLSEQSQQEVLKHQAACLSSLKDYRNSDENSAFISDLDAMIRLGHQEKPEGTSPATENRSSQQNANQPRHSSVTEFHEIAPSMANEVRQHRDDRTVQKRAAILRWICDSSDENRYQGFISTKAPGTCEWFFEEDNYKHWLNGNRRVLLSIAGSGKTVLMAAIVDRLRQIYQGEEKVATAFYFFDRRDFSYHAEVEASVLKSFLRQILYLKDHIPKSIEDLYDNRIRFRPLSNSEVLQALKETMHSFDKVHLLIDGFDEIPADEIEDMKSRLESLLEDFGHIRVLISSRYVIPLSQWSIARSALTIDTKGAKEVNGDIERYIDPQLATRKFQYMLGADERKELRTKLVENSGGKFVWVELALDDIARQPSQREMRNALTKIPHSLPDVYDSIFERIQTQRPLMKNLAQIVLTWLLASKSPLSITEMLHAVAFSSRKSHTHDFSDVKDEDIISSCHGLVVILDDEPRTVAPVHSSVLDWDDEHYPRLFPEKHNQIASTCIAYLTEAIQEQQRTRKPITELLLQYPLFPYTAKSWPYHAGLLERVDEPNHAGLQERVEEISAFLENKECVSTWLDVLEHENIRFLETIQKAVPVDLLRQSPKAIASALSLPDTAA